MTGPTPIPPQADPDGGQRAGETKAPLTVSSDPSVPLFPMTEIKSRDADNAAASPANALRVDGYQIIATLGQGGMGNVWRAVQLSTRRQVALKFMHLSLLGSDRARRRFEREVELTARLDHPNIASVYDSGIHQGVCYYAMELVEDSSPLDQYCRKNALDRPAILRLFSIICRAVQHAHQRGVIHRDLKPGNILVDASGQPKVVDFGLAHFFLAGSDELTQSQDGLAGTLLYMSPEQAEARSDLDTRSDVYSLGVILYTILTGWHPHWMDGDCANARAILVSLVSEEVRRPRESDATITTDLERLLLKALSKDREQRYASAGALADDLDNYLAGEPLSARAPTTFYLLSKRVKKYRLRVSLAAAVLIVLAVVAVTADLRVRAVRVVAEQQKGIAEERTKVAQHEQRVATSELGNSLFAQANALAAAADWEQALHRFGDAEAVLTSVGDGSERASLCRWRAGNLVPPPLLTIPGSAADFTAISFSPDGRFAVTAARVPAIRTPGLEMVQNRAQSQLKLWDTLNGRLVIAFPDHPAQSIKSQNGTMSRIDAPAVRRIAFSPNGKIVATSSNLPLIEIWDVGTGRLQRRLLPDPMEDDSSVACLSFSPDGTRLASGNSGGTFTIWDFDSAKPIRTVAVLKAEGYSEGCTVVSWSHDGRRLLVGGTHGGLALWDADTGKSVGQDMRQEWSMPLAAVFSPDDTQVLTGHVDHVARVWDMAGGGRLRATLSGHGSAVRAVAFAPDGKVAVTADDYEGFRLWATKEWNPTGEVHGRCRRIAEIAISPDGRMALGGGLSTGVNSDDPLKLWALSAPEPVFNIDASRGDKSNAEVALNGALVLAAPWYPSAPVTVWDMPTRSLLPSVPIDGENMKLLLRPGGKPLVCLGRIQGVSTLHDPLTGRKLGVFPGTGLVPKSCVFSPDGRWLASQVGSDKPNSDMIKLWDLSGNREFAAWPWAATDEARLAISADGKFLLAIADKEGARRVSILNPYRMSPARFIVAGHPVDALALSADGSSALIGSDNGTIELWNTGTASLVRTFQGHHSPVNCLAFSPDGKTAISGNLDDLVTFWSLANGQEVLSLSLNEFNARFAEQMVIADAPQKWVRSHLGIQQLSYSEDGRTVLAVDSFRQAALWNLDHHMIEQQAADRAAGAVKTLIDSPQDPAALATLGDWYAFHFLWDRAAICLEQSVAAGGNVSPLLLGRCHWQLGQKDRARREFEQAKQKGEAPPEYLDLLLRALDPAAGN